MSDDNVARFLRQHADEARKTCPEIPENVHPHMLRHIYAHADTEMKRQALAKATGGISAGPPPLPIWHDREDIIQQLCGLTTWTR